MADDPFFKIRATKRSNPQSRTTLDSIHHAHLEKLLADTQNTDELISKIREAKTALKECQDEIRMSQLERECDELVSEYQKRKSGEAVFDYFLETGDILYNYYDIQEKINQGAEVKSAKPIKVRPGSIFAALEDAAAEDGEVAAPKAVPAGQDLSRDKLLESYLQKVNPEYARSSGTEAEPYDECEDCHTEMIFSANEALFSCPACGRQDFVLVDSDKPSYKDPPREISYYAYKRINHFNEWLAQFQAKESTEIPQEVYDSILAELKKWRVTDYSTLKRSHIREILKKLDFNKYYEHVPHIINRLNGVNAPIMTREVEDKLRHMFIEIQPSFQKHCPKSRNNFLSYSYVLYKFCELLELDEYLPNFSLLKNRDKLFQQDKIWQLICKDLQWEFIRSL
jgi:hypothetical protein